MFVGTIESVRVGCDIGLSLNVCELASTLIRPSNRPNNYSTYVELNLVLCEPCLSLVLGGDSVLHISSGRTCILALLNHRTTFFLTLLILFLEFLRGLSSLLGVLLSGGSSRLSLLLLLLLLVSALLATLLLLSFLLATFLGEGTTLGPRATDGVRESGDDRGPCKRIGVRLNRGHDAGEIGEGSGVLLGGLLSAQVLALVLDQSALNCVDHCGYDF